MSPKNVESVFFLLKIMRFGTTVEHIILRQMVEILTNFQDAFGGMSPFGQFEEMGKQNMAMFENAMKIFSPFHPHGADDDKGKAATESASADKPASNEGSDLNALKMQLAQMQQQLERMSENGE